LLFLGERVPTNSDSTFESLWNVTASAVVNLIDAYGWVISATVLTILFLIVIGLICWWMEDLPFELPVFESVSGIFKWMRKTWQSERGGYSLTK
jgi:hypothetical protein